MGFTNRSRGKDMFAWLWAKIFIRSVTNTITAFAGGGKASATQLGYGINRISVCATAADSVLMPPAILGVEVIIIHDGAAAAQVFGKGTDTIDAVVTATGVVLTNAKRCAYYCHVAGAWTSNMGVKSA